MSFSQRGLCLGMIHLHNLALLLLVPLAFFLTKTTKASSQSVFLPDFCSAPVHYSVNMAPSPTTAPSIHYPKDVYTTLNYYLDPALGGHLAFEAGTVGYYRRKFDERPVQIHDIRGQIGDFNISKQGFQLIKHISAEKDYTNDEQVKRIVYPEVEELLKKV